MTDLREQIENKIIEAYELVSRQVAYEHIHPEEFKRRLGGESSKKILALINCWLEEQEAVTEIRNPNWPQDRGEKWIYQPLRVESGEMTDQVLMLNLKEELREKIEQELSQYSSALLAYKSWGMDALERVHALKIESADTIFALIQDAGYKSPGESLKRGEAPSVESLPTKEGK